jgi:hypothetical protein
MLGLLPDLEDAAAINEALYIPLEPTRPAGAKGPAAGPAPAPAPPPVAAVPPKPGHSPTLPASVLPAVRPSARDMRHEASLQIAPASSVDR